MFFPIAASTSPIYLPAHNSVFLLSLLVLFDLRECMRLSEHTIRRIWCNSMGDRFNIRLSNSWRLVFCASGIGTCGTPWCRSLLGGRHCERTYSLLSRSSICGE